jgi:predicted RNA methylase
MNMKTAVFFCLALAAAGAQAAPSAIGAELERRTLPKQGEFTAVELFAGAGGLSIGLERAGIHVVIANEIMPDFAATLAANRLDAKAINEDCSLEAA